MITVTDTNFDEVVTKATIPTLIDFNADWCGPCQAQKPALDALEDSADGKYQIVSINIDESPNLAEKYEVSSIPCLVLLKDGEEVERKVGLQPKNVLESMLGDA